jgi:hypothetical protein
MFLGIGFERKIVSEREDDPALLAHGCDVVTAITVRLIHVFYPQAFQGALRRHAIFVPAPHAIILIERF